MLRERRKILRNYYKKIGKTHCKAGEKIVKWDKRKVL